MTHSLIKACILGWPVSHSRSPLIHNYWLDKTGIQGSYEAIAVSPDEFASTFRSLADKGFSGANITLPHKQHAFQLCDDIDKHAKTIGAVNTVKFSGGRISGYNTDAHGFITNLKKSAPDWRADNGPAIILGAGGAARAVIAALLEEKVAKIAIVNRTLAHALKLKKDFGPLITCVPWENREDVLEYAGLLVNTTSLGMSGKPPLEISIDILNKKAAVADIVYTPLETPLLKAARNNGNAVANGLGMLLHQAVPGFELWFGLRPEVTPELYQLAADDLTGTS